MGDYLKVSTSKLRSEADRIEELKETIPTLMNELEAAMQQLAGCWEGPAWGAYQQNVAHHMEMLSDIYDYMSRYTIYMQEASKNYGYTEQDICADIRMVLTLT